MWRQISVAALATLFMAAPVAAQQIVIQNRSSAVAGAKDEIRVGVSMNFFVAASDDGSTETIKAQEHARGVLYDSAAQECALLRASLASDCRLESINVNVRMQRSFGRQQPEGFSANGNFVFKIKLK